MVKYKYTDIFQGKQVFDNIQGEQTLFYLNRNCHTWKEKGKREGKKKKGKKKKGKPKVTLECDPAQPS